MGFASLQIIVEVLPFLTNRSCLLTNNFIHFRQTVNRIQLLNRSRQGFILCSLLLCESKVHHPQEEQTQQCHQNSKSEVRSDLQSCIFATPPPSWQLSLCPLTRSRISCMKGFGCNSGIGLVVFFFVVVIAHFQIVLLKFHRKNVPFRQTFRDVYRLVKTLVHVPSPSNQPLAQ